MRQLVVGMTVCVAAISTAAPQLRTGPGKPKVVAATARVTARVVDGPAETLLVELTSSELELLGPSAEVLVPQAWSATVPFTAGAPAQICVRRKISAEPVSGTYYHGELTAPFQAALSSPLATMPTSTCLRAFADLPRRGAVYAYAAARLGEMAAPKTTKAPTTNAPLPTASSDDDYERHEFLRSLMDTTTGLHSLDEALQTRRHIWLRSTEKADVPFKTLVPPRVAQHPWPAMLAHLKTPVPSEKLAEAVPAEFSYVRAKRVDTFLRLLDQVDAWVTPAVAVVDREFADRAIGERYQSELGLERTPLSRLFGPSVIAEIGLCTSDAYVREGTDLTVILRAKNGPLLSQALDGMLEGHRRRHADLTTRTQKMGDVDVRISTTPDGVVRQHRATVGDLEIVSNNAVAIERVLQAVAGKRPRLVDEPDFRYMLARDAGAPDDILAYLGERFIGNTTGPRQKILEARRVVAGAELATPGYAALLYGWMYGRAPKDVGEIVRANLLEKRDLSHRDGSPITFVPGSAARSKWGTVSSLTPLIGSKEPDFVTKSEAEGYRAFAQSYEQTWSDYVDPVALRISASTVDKGLARWTFDVRILPLLRTGDYREIMRWVGQARFEVSAPTDGARAVLGIGQDARIRREGKDLVSLPGMGPISFDWLGSWGMVGIGDTPSILAAVQHWWDAELPQRPRTDGDPPRSDDSDAMWFGRLPFYAGVGVKSAVTAGLFMAAARELGKKTMGDRIEFVDTGMHKKMRITDIRLRERASDPRRDWHVFYALTDDQLLFCLDRKWLMRLLDESSAGTLPREPATKKAGTQLAVDVVSPINGPLWTFLLWSTEAVARNESRRSEELANALFAGAPELESTDGLAMAYFGARPTTPSGRGYVRGPDGARDPERGSRLSPTWPSLPMAGAALTKALERLAQARSEVSLDDEGVPQAGVQPQSFHGRLTLQLRE